MKDGFGREIDYMRLSITDRCNLRCRYCMPRGRPFMPHDEILRYEEILRIASVATDLGISHFKVTGGDPLVRRGAVDLVASLKSLPGVDTVTLTTNGILLPESLPALAKAAVDGINVSLDALSPDLYRRMAGGGDPATVLDAVRRCVDLGVPTKINTVLLEENECEWMRVLAIAEELPVSVRFIEMMPIGKARDASEAPEVDRLLAMARERYADLAPVEEPLGCGPATYFGSSALKGRLGIIAARSHAFCSLCNRVRLTSTGQLRLCLGRPDSVDLKELLRGGAGHGDVRTAMERAIAGKPAAHMFGSGGAAGPERPMNEIGG